MTKGLGFKRNELTETHISEIVRLYKEFDKKENSQFVKVLDKKDFYYKEVPCYQPFQRNFVIAADRIENIKSTNAFKKLYDEDSYQELEELETKTSVQVSKMKSMLEGKRVQENILHVLSDNISNTIYYNKNEFTKLLLRLLPELKENKTLIKAIVLSLSEDDDKADKYYDKKGRVESDPDLKDSEIIPYKIKNEDYFNMEVKPFISDAWLETDEKKIAEGCEINFNKYFYVYHEPELCESILKRLEGLEKKEKELEGKLYGGK